MANLTPSATIATLSQEPLIALGNRQDIGAGSPSRMNNWVMRSYIDIGMAFPFHTLEFSKVVQTTQGQDYIDYPGDARAIKSITSVDPNTGGVLPMSNKTLQYLRRFQTANQASANQSQPAIWAPYGPKIFMRPIPGTAYDIYIDYWQLPQIAEDVVSTPILLPYDWFEVVEYLAIARGHVNLGERDKAQQIHQFLYGWTSRITERMVPGIVQQKWTRYQAQTPYIDYGLQPSSVRRSYTSV